MVDTQSSPADLDSRQQTPFPYFQQKPDRGKELWNILKNSVKATTDLVKKADAKPAIVRHGVHHYRKINHDEAISDVIYNSTTEEYVTVDHQYIRIFHKDGRRKDIIDLGIQISKLEFCGESGHYVALVAPQELRLYNNEFDLVSAAKSPNNVACMIYNPSTNELVTSGPGYLMTWCFRYGNRYIVPHHTAKEGLTCKDCFDKLALERTQSNSQRCFAACGTSVAVFNLFDTKLLSYKKDLHVRNITSILFFNPLKYIVTGSRDGSIKVWDERFNVLLVFVGHRGTVTSLNFYPQGPYIMSSSLDGSIRVWSLETCDEVDLIVMEDPVLGMGTTPREKQLFTFSRYAVDLWNITHVHQVFTAVEDPVFKLKMTPHPQLIDRVVSQTVEGIIHIISPVDGTVITNMVSPDKFLSLHTLQASLPMPTEDESKMSLVTTDADMLTSSELIDAVYSLPIETIFALYGGNCLVKASTLTNPAKIKRIWNYDKEQELSCLCFYEYTVNIVQSRTTWEDVKKGSKVTRKFLDTPKYGNRIILLAGRKDGSIVNIDMFNGELLDCIEAHSSKEVICLVANVPTDQVISAGRDNVVKIWKMFPNTQEPLGLVMSFYCAHVPVHLSIGGSRLVVAFQQPSTATYTVVMYDLVSKERFDHSPDYDHTDDMVGLSCCPRLKLFASASRDGTIRIWNNDNSLLRVIKVNDDPKSITFCNQRGDLLVGLGKNIHIIRHSDYLPKANLYRMFCMKFPVQQTEEAFPFAPKILETLRLEIVRKLRHAKSSYLAVVHDWDPRTDEEQARLALEKKEKLGAYAHYASRDGELARIKEGLLVPKRARRRKSMRNQTKAFQKYMDLFYDRPKKVDIPDEDTFNPDPPPVRQPSPVVFVPETKIGFFPPINAAKPVKELLDGGMEREKHLAESGPDYDTDKRFIIPPSGFIPNSVLIKLLWPQDEVKKLEEDIYKPPALSDEQKEMLQHMEKVSAEAAAAQPSEGGDSSDVNRILMMESDEEWEDEEKIMSYEEEAIVPSAGKPKKLVRKQSIMQDRKIDAKPSSFLEKMRKAMETPPPPPKEPTPPPTPPPPEPKLKSPTKPIKPIVRYVSRPPPPKEPTPPPPTPPPPTPPPPPPTPPPQYLIQFEGLPWFERHKNYIKERMNTPPSALHFFKIICDLLGISIDWEHRSAIVDALLLLWQQENMTSARHVLPALTSLLSAAVPPSVKDPVQVIFLRSALKLYQAVAGGSEEFFVELLTQFLEADHTHKSFIRSLLLEQGLQDPHQYLSKELESWELWQLDESRSMKAQLREMVEKWIRDWNLRFKNHVEDTLERLKKGDVRANVRRPGLSKTAESGKRVHFEVSYSEGTKTATIEVLNYFCEMRLEEELEKTRLANLKPEPTKNTVLVLPKLEGRQAIVRLGEMHTARRVRERQEQLAAEYKLNPFTRPYPDLMASFTCKVALPTSRVYMNPFPSEVDRFDQWTDQYQPILLTLRSPDHQKYFIPERSYVHV